jgi:diguanylate cyclase (GGDEF)-like protein
MSIKKSLRILLIISSIIPVVLVSVIANGLLTNKLVDMQTENMQRTAESNKIGLEALLDTQKTEVSLLSMQSELQDLVKLSDHSIKKNPRIVNRMLQERKDSNQFCVSISLYNIKNEVIASSDPGKIGKISGADMALTYMFATKNNAVGVDGILPADESGKKIYTIDIGAPMINPETDTLTGYVISTINLSYFGRFLSTASTGNTGFCILLDRNGNIVYHPDASLISTNINSGKLSSLISDYKRGLLQPSGNFEITVNNTKQVYAYSMLPELNWVVLVKQDLSEMRPFTTMLMLSLLFFICTILLIIIIIFANTLAKRFSAPIISLRDAMRTASDGNLTVQSNIKSKNELGELSKNFNKMLHIIKTNYEDLASMHEELLSNEEQLRSNYDHIEFLAYHDILTNLPNKLAFLDYVNAALVTSVAERKIHAVYFVDLDNFKTVNDTLGHEYGDALLVRTSQILTGIIGENGMLARAGGDEFLIFKENTATSEAAVNFASQMIDCFRNPLDLEGEVVYVSMSIAT